MRLTLPFVLAAALLGALAVPASGQAVPQERSWSLSLFVEGGGLLPIRTLGRNVGIFPQIDQQQGVSDLENTAAFGGGAELLLREKNIRFRAAYHTTSGGSVVGRLGFCGDPGNPLVTGDLCEQIESDAQVQSFSADVGFIRGREGALLRPVIYLGAGIRKYTIAEISCPPTTTPDVVEEIQARTCLLMEDIWSETGGLTPTLRFGLGLDVNLGPLALRTTAMDIVGRYPGGTNGADGHGQNDVFLTAGLAVKVF